jgi:hypothetical protein
VAEDGKVKAVNTPVAFIEYAAFSVQTGTTAPLGHNANAADCAFKVLFGKKYEGDATPYS